MVRSHRADRRKFFVALGFVIASVVLSSLTVMAMNDTDDRDGRLPWGTVVPRTEATAAARGD